VTEGGLAPVDLKSILFSFVGIAYMFLKLAQSGRYKQEVPALEYAKHYITIAKNRAHIYAKREEERCSFLCGNAGIFAVSAVISYLSGDLKELKNDVLCYKTGLSVCHRLDFNQYGSDEVLFGRAGYLLGMYWLNQQLNVSANQPKWFTHDEIILVCETMMLSGTKYSDAHNSPLPLMYVCYGEEYLGAAHGVSAVLHTILEAPWFRKTTGKEELIPRTVLRDIKAAVDSYVGMQDAEGNFPTTLGDVRAKREDRLVHWCHGAPGAVYMLAKAYLIFGKEKYLEACKKCGELVWEKGLLYKGPGICHGVAGNGYVFLLLYRLTRDLKYLYRASKFAEFLTNDIFRRHSRTPDRPYSLFEGYAGTVCFLLDLLDPDKASFPFMDVFDTKY
jgi:lantibiotic modifying enzyme